MNKKGIRYEYPSKPSSGARLIQKSLGLIGFKDKFDKTELKKGHPSKAAGIPGKIYRNNEVIVSETDGHRVWKIVPRRKAGDQVILYLHGGGYVHNMVVLHWDIIEKLLAKTNQTVIVPDYPMAPDYTYKDTFAFLDHVYQSVVIPATKGNLTFMGDSAGGGLCLAYAEKLRNEKAAIQPQKIILISPWLDVTMSDPQINEIDTQDKLLGVEGLINSGKAYAGGTDTTNYLISPIYGDVSGLGEISIFTGTNDILNPDARKLRDRMDAENLPVNFFEYPGMFHVWVAMTWLPESKMAISQIVSLLNA